MILVEVVSRGRVEGNIGWWDELACGHLVAFDGAHDVQRRRCRQCERVEESQQTRLPFDA